MYFVSISNTTTLPLVPIINNSTRTLVLFSRAVYMKAEEVLRTRTCDTNYWTTAVRPFLCFWDCRGKTWPQKKRLWRTISSAIACFVLLGAITLEMVFDIVKEVSIYPSVELSIYRIEPLSPSIRWHLRVFFLCRYCCIERKLPRLWSVGYEEKRIRGIYPGITRTRHSSKFRTTSMPVPWTFACSVFCTPVEQYPGYAGATFCTSTRYSFEFCTTPLSRPILVWVL